MPSSMLTSLFMQEKIDYNAGSLAVSVLVAPAFGHKAILHMSSLNIEECVERGSGKPIPNLLF